MRQKLTLNKPEFVMAWRLWQFGFALPRIVAELKGLRLEMGIKKCACHRKEIGRETRQAQPFKTSYSIANFEEDVK